MNYAYKDKLYTIRKIDIKDFQQYEGKWYPTVFYEDEEGLRSNRSAKEFFDKFELYKEYTREELEKDIKKHLAKDIAKDIVLHSTPKSGTFLDRVLERLFKEMPILKNNEYTVEKVQGDSINDSIIIRNINDDEKGFLMPFQNTKEEWVELKKEVYDYFNIT